MDDLIKARRSSRPWRQHLLVKTLREDASAAQNGVTMKPARQDNDMDGFVRDRKIGQPPLITTMDPRRSGAASRTTAGLARSPHCEHGTAEIITHAFNDKTNRNQTRRLDGVAHDIDSLRENNASWRLNFIKIESDPSSHAE